MRALGREDLRLHRDSGAVSYRRFALWLVIGLMVLGITALTLAAFATTGTPSGPPVLPMPQPAPVGP